MPDNLSSIRSSHVVVHVVRQEISDLESFSSNQGDIRESSYGQTAHQRARDCMVFGDLLPPTLDDKEEGDGREVRGMDDRDDNRASHCGSEKSAPLVPHDNSGLMRSAAIRRRGAILT